MVACIFDPLVIHIWLINNFKTTSLNGHPTKVESGFGIDRDEQKRMPCLYSKKVSCCLSSKTFVCNFSKLINISFFE